MSPTDSPPTAPVVPVPIHVQALNGLKRQLSPNDVSSPQSVNASIEEASAASLIGSSSHVSAHPKKRAVKVRRRSKRMNSSSALSATTKPSTKAVSSPRKHSHDLRSGHPSGTSESPKATSRPRRSSRRSKGSSSTGKVTPKRRPRQLSSSTMKPGKQTESVH